MKKFSTILPLLYAAGYIDDSFSTLNFHQSKNIPDEPQSEENKQYYLAKAKEKRLRKMLKRIENP